MINVSVKHQRISMGAPAIKAQVTVAAVTTLVLAANTARTHAILKADEANTEAIYLAVGEIAIQAYGISLDPGETLQIGPDFHTPLVINGICASGGMLMNVWVAQPWPVVPSNSKLDNQSTELGKCVCSYLRVVLPRGGVLPQRISRKTGRFAQHSARHIFLIGATVLQLRELVPVETRP